MVYTIAILLIKISILLLLLRVFSPSRAIFMIIHVNLWANIFSYTGGRFTEELQFIPGLAI